MPGSHPIISRHFEAEKIFWQLVGPLDNPVDKVIKTKNHAETWFFKLLRRKVSVFVLMFLFCLQKIEISERCAETDQHGDDGDKSTCSVSDILFKHG